MTVPNGSIIIDSATGSDTAASGLGPATAVSGAGASLNSTSTVDLSADTPDLSGVSAGDLLWVDTSSGRQFSIIASVNDGADTVTCDDAFSVTESGKNWGIGGKRASLGNSSRLFTNDGHGRWVIELADGHSETISSTLTAAVSLSSTEGPIILRGESGATTKPILTFSNNGVSISLSVSYYVIRDIEFRNTNATKTASIAVDFNNIAYGWCDGLTIAHSTNNYWRGIKYSSAAVDPLVSNCEIANTAENGIYADNGVPRVKNCYLHDCTSYGIYTNNSAGGGFFYQCVFDTNGSSGLGINDVGGLGTSTTRTFVVECVFYNNAANGIDVANAPRAADYVTFVNNIFEANGGYGIDFNGATSDFLDSVSLCVDRNGFYNNTSGKYLPTDLNSTNESVLTGSAFVDAANADFNLNNTSGGGATLRAVTYDLPG